MKFEYTNNDLLEMARVGYFDEYEVYIHTDDPGRIPHFHIRDAATRGQYFHTCLRIDKPLYFHHTGKEDSLNKSDRKDLVDFLKSRGKGPFKTNWEALVYEWNRNNSDIELPYDIEIPDYTNM